MLRYIVTDKKRNIVHHGRSTDLYTTEKQARRYGVNGWRDATVLVVDLDSLEEVHEVKVVQRQPAETGQGGVRHGAAGSSN